MLRRRSLYKKDGFIYPLNGLISYYTCDDTPNDYLDNNNGTIVGIVNEITDRNGNADSAYSIPTLDAGHIDIEPFSGIDWDSGTINLWCRVVYTSAGNDIVGFAPGNDFLALRSTGTALDPIVRFRYRGASINSDIEVAGDFDDWQMYTATWDNGDMELLKNGVSAGTNTYATAITGSAIYASIMAKAQDDIKTGVAGSFDEILVYNRPLSNAEIINIYNLG